jgi:Ca2+-binding EF-hand superfamily protein
MSDDFYARKISHFFRILDVNGDGLLDKDDLLASPRALAAREGFSLNSAETRRAVDAFHGFYTPLLRDADTNHDGVISPDEFVAHWREVMAQARRADPAEMLAVDFYHGCANNLFDLLDKDDNGYIEYDEYDHYLDSFNGDIDLDRRAAFDGFDKDGSGRISRAEFNRALQEFFLDDDERAAGNHFFGELP